jgi:signal transduction histidine kinase
MTPRVDAGPRIAVAMTTAAGPAAPGRSLSLLARAGGLDPLVHGVLVVLLLGSALRYVLGHGFADRAPLVLTAVVLLLLVYAAGPPLRRRGLPGPLWLGVVVLAWLVLVLLAPSFAWCAVPLAFVALRVLPFAAARVVVGAMVLTVVAAWSVMTGQVDPTVMLGPACIAVLAVGAYRELQRDASARAALVADLQQAQGELAEEQRRAGALAERGRLSREIHDSVAQGLSSINLLLQAAEHEWVARPAGARAHVAQAAATARDSLDEVRRVVRDLVPPELAGSAGGVAALPAALRRSCERLAGHTDLQVRVEVYGEPVPLGSEVETALLRTARGALANVVEHAQAAKAVVTLTYSPEGVSLDVRDDGRGFSGTPRGSAGRGLGLRGIRDRVEALGGELFVESGPGEGTALAVRIPAEAARD